jgi:hypothetical protein
VAKVNLEADGSVFELEEIKDAPLSQSHAIASLALNFAMKYADMTLVKDGALYQQYKLEGRNVETIHLDWVLGVAKQIEAHLMSAPGRLAPLVCDMITDVIEQIVAEEEPTVVDGSAEGVAAQVEGDKSREEP